MGKTIAHLIVDSPTKIQTSTVPLALSLQTALVRQRETKLGAIRYRCTFLLSAIGRKQGVCFRSTVNECTTEALSENSISQKLLGELKNTIWQKLRGEKVDYFYFQIYATFS